MPTPITTPDSSRPPDFRPQRGATLWLTGLPGSGKSTLARTTAAALAERGRRVEVLDGDELRTNLSADLGFSAHDRNVHVQRVGFIARLLAGNGVIVLVPVIAPYAEARAAVRHQHEDRGCDYLEIHVATPVAECMRRDPKGLYGRARAGELSGLTGFDAVYEEPVSPELRLDTTELGTGTACDAVLDLLSHHAPADRRERPGPLAEVAE